MARLPAPAEDSSSSFTKRLRPWLGPKSGLFSQAPRALGLAEAQDAPPGHTSALRMPSPQHPSAGSLHARRHRLRVPPAVPDP